MRRHVTSWVLSILVISWFCAIVLASHSQRFTSWSGLGPLSAVQTSIVLPVVVFWVAYVLVRPFRFWIEGLSLVDLAAIQVMRVLGATHLFTWGTGRMAGTFAILVGIGNLAVSILALVTVNRIARRTKTYRRWLVCLTVLGTLEFAMTIGLAVAGVFARPLSFDPPIAPSGYLDFRELPLSVFPTFLIPFFLLVHCVTIVRLINPCRNRVFDAAAR